MPRSALGYFLRRAASISLESRRYHRTIAQQLEGDRQPLHSRRGFISTSAKTALLVSAAGWTSFLESALARKSTASVAIVGGGLAGLTCAWRLKQAGLQATVYEASTSLGGRCRTMRNHFDEGQIVERGGELIDTDHKAVRTLARKLGLQLDDLRAAEPRRTGPFYFFATVPYSFVQATRDFDAIFDRLEADLRAAGYPTQFNHYTARGLELDRISVLDYLNQIVPGGVGSRLGQLLNVAYLIEHGAETSDQSALNLLYLLGYSHRRRLQIFGQSDERFRIRGGNDQLVSRLAAKLESQITLGHELVAIKRTSDGRVNLTFQEDSSVADIVADKVVLALPFSILRRSVDLSQSGFSSLKRVAINELGMGTGSKLHLQFSRRQWNILGCNGDTYADTGYQNTWESTRAQNGISGILVDFTGGTVGAEMNEGTTMDRAQMFLQQIEPVLPGVTSSFNGKATLDYWTGNPWSRGAYSYWKVGQYVRFAGIEGTQEGNCHFCGEHTSRDFQGYLNGAVETGARVAAEVIADLGLNAGYDSGNRLGSTMSELRA